MLSYSFIDRDGTERSCQSSQDLSGLIDSGAITPTTFFWDDQKQRWLKATEVEEYVRAQEIVDDARTRRRKSSASIRSKAAVDFREPGIRNAKLLDYAAGNPHYRIHKATIASRILLVPGALFVSAILWQSYLLNRLGSLIKQYGLGHLPTALIPKGLELSETAIMATQYIWCFGMLACLMYCFYQTCVVLKTCCGAKMKYPFGWTVGSLFIPVMFLYRPWFGLAEIRRKAIELRFSVATRVDLYTVVFATAFFILITTMIVANGEISRLVLKVGDVDINYLAIATNLELAEEVAVTAITIFCYYYCQSALVAVREILLRNISSNHC
jgi:hypothetical protein